jgi:N-acetylmuramoyl-L-alanine amidase
MVGLGIKMWCVILLAQPLLSHASKTFPLEIVNRPSPLNDRRPFRDRTTMIILHTTESGGDSVDGSLDKLRRYGEANYMVHQNGTVYKIVDDRKIAAHAGVSMWNKVTAVDRFSVGIEVAGFHHTPPSANQIMALKELVRQLQIKYNVPDHMVLSHSAVAFGYPNRWHSKKHRGRKRCGMAMGTKDVRELLGLSVRPRRDPDVVARRLVVADRDLHNVLYGSDPTSVLRSQLALNGPASNVIAADRSAWSIAGDKFDDESTSYKFPNGDIQTGNRIEDWDKLPAGTVVTLNVNRPSAANADFDEQKQEDPDFKIISNKNRTAYSIAREDYRKPSTIYFLNDGRVLPGSRMRSVDFASLDLGTKILMGYVYGGHISSARSMFSVAGRKWSDPSTLYRTPDGAFSNGDDIDPSRIPAGTLILFLK